jgi:hypothetical protein
MNESGLISLFGPAHQIVNPLELVTQRAEPNHPDSLASHLHNSETQKSAKFVGKIELEIFVNNLFSGATKRPKN